MEPLEAQKQECFADDTDMDRKRFRELLGFAAVGGAAVFVLALAAGSPSSGAASDSVFAVIDGERVTESEFQSFLLQFARGKFYHRVPEGGVESVKAEAAEALIRQRLLIQEAKRRGLEGNPQAVAEQLASYEERYRGDESWQRMRGERQRLREALLDRSRVSALEEQIRRVEDPGEVALSAYYRNNIGLFTEPARSHLQVILIGVQPWEGSQVWKQAQQKAERLGTEIAAGASFEALARANSTHVSAEQGGDLGFLHNGVLSTPAEAAVDRLSEGEVSPPVRVLEGYALFRLLERRLPRVRDFADVRSRALQLYQRDEADRRWTRFLSELRASAEVVIPENEETTQSE